MKLIKPSYEILSDINTSDILKKIEIAGRTCYKSENKIDETSAEEFVEMILNRGHESVIEHRSLTVKFICDRGVSHELVRHRLSSFSQESTRYCNYSKDKFDNQLTFIIPEWFDKSRFTPDVYEVDNWDTLGPIIRNSSGTNMHFADIKEHRWALHMLWSERMYKYLTDPVDNKWRPEQARSVLPNSLKTEIVVTSNLRHWREIFRQRTAKVAHPQMRELMIPLLEELKVKIPIIFDDILA
jgi:thymidylate synthase (FAD)